MKLFCTGGVNPPLMYVAGPQNRDAHPTSRRALLPKVSKPLNWIPNAYGISMIQFATMCCRPSLPPLSVCFGMPTALGYEAGNDPVRSPMLSEPAMERLAYVYRMPAPQPNRRLVRRWGRRT